MVLIKKMMIMDLDDIKNLQLAFWDVNIKNFLMSKNLPLDTPFEQVVDLILKSRNMDFIILKNYIIKHQKDFYNMPAEQIQADLMKPDELIALPGVIGGLLLAGTMLYFLFKK